MHRIQVGSDAYDARSVAVAAKLRLELVNLELHHDFRQDGQIGHRVCTGQTPDGSGKFK
ncbi:MULTISPECIES: hypothetical protein [Streptomyces]|uniref:hypothetical protein n=1 Tax=Streptomyces TaxID=1883 RepID=UPI00159F112C|nr:hypothetical protein [Streptomyces sp. SceaMP-e96]